MNKNQKIIKKSTTDVFNMLPIIATTGVLGLMLGGMNKMFGESEKIPKGVVKEMMQGIMEGVIDMINQKDFDINDQKEEVRRYKEKFEKSEKQLEKAEDEIVRLESVLSDVKSKTKPKPKKKVKK